MIYTYITNLIQKNQKNIFFDLKYSNPITPSFVEFEGLILFPIWRKLMKYDKRELVSMNTPLKANFEIVKFKLQEKI